jgi:hypothetical protein
VLAPGDPNNLVRDLNLSKRQAELLASRLKGRDHLNKYIEICFFCNHQNIFKEFFSEENDLVLCNDVCSFIQALGHQHDPTEWRLLTLQKLA